MAFPRSNNFLPPSNSAASVKEHCPHRPCHRQPGILHKRIGADPGSPRCLLNSAHLRSGCDLHLKELCASLRGVTKYSFDHITGHGNPSTLQLLLDTLSFLLQHFGLLGLTNCLASLKQLPTSVEQSCQRNDQRPVQAHDCCFKPLVKPEIALRQICSELPGNDGSQGETARLPADASVLEPFRHLGLSLSHYTCGGSGWLLAQRHNEGHGVVPGVGHAD